MELWYAVRNLRRNPVLQLEWRRRAGVRRWLLALAVVGIGSAAMAAVAHLHWVGGDLRLFLGPLLAGSLYVALPAMAAASAAAAASRDRATGAWDALRLTLLSGEEILLARVLPPLTEGALLLAGLAPLVWWVGAPYRPDAEELLWAAHALGWVLAAAVPLGVLVGWRGDARAWAAGGAAAVVVLGEFAVAAVAVSASSHIALLLFLFPLSPSPEPEGIRFYLSFAVLNVLLAGGAWLFALYAVRGATPAARFRHRLAALVLAVFLCMALFVGTAVVVHRVRWPGGRSLPFDPNRWAAMFHAPDGSLRGHPGPVAWQRANAAMVSDLLAHHLRPGMRRDAVEALLGTKGWAGSGAMACTRTRSGTTTWSVFRLSVSRWRPGADGELCTRCWSWSSATAGWSAPGCAEGMPG